jgi:2-hydroxychromene-2-carboxylate isomerase
MARAQAPETSAAQDVLTEEALARGVFGAPTYALGDELFWGQDRLDFLDRALAEA